MGVAVERELGELSDLRPVSVRGGHVIEGEEAVQAELAQILAEEQVKVS